MPIITQIALSLPIVISVFLLTISSIPIDIAGVAAFFPVVDVMVIYYWCSYRPGSIPDWFIFLLGIMRDSIEGITLGTTAFIYLIVRFIVSSSRSIYRRENFFIVWQGFSIMVLIAISLKWLILSLLIDTTLVLDSAMMQFMVSIATYPIFHWFFNVIQEMMPENYYDA